MKTEISREILAIVTVNKESVAGGSPTFFVDNDEELTRTALLLSRIFMGAVHEIKTGTLIVVRH